MDTNTFNAVVDKLSSTIGAACTNVGAVVKPVALETVNEISMRGKALCIYYGSLSAMFLLVTLGLLGLMLYGCAQVRKSKTDGLGYKDANRLEGRGFVCIMIGTCGALVTIGLSGALLSSASAALREWVAPLAHLFKV